MQPILFYPHIFNIALRNSECLPPYIRRYSPGIHTLSVNITKRPRQRIHQLADHLWLRQLPQSNIHHIVQRRVPGGQITHNGRPVNNILARRRSLVLPRPVQPVDGGMVQEKHRVAWRGEEVLCTR